MPTSRNEPIASERWRAFRFAAIVCVVCSLAVSVAAVALGPAQEKNAARFREQQLLRAAGHLREGEAPSAEAVRDRYARGLRERRLDLRSGHYLPKRAAGPERLLSMEATDSREAPPNEAGIKRLPEAIAVYEILEEGQVVGVVLPVQGKGLWSTLWGYLALEADGNTVRNLVFYEHGETPGLGGEIDSARWRALWPGTRLVDERGELRLTVGKRLPPATSQEPRDADTPHDTRAGALVEDDFRVDAIAGATITSQGVGTMLRFWLGADAFGPYLARLRAREVDFDEL